MELKREQDQTRELLGNEYKDYNLVLATSFGMPIGGSHLREKMQDIIDKEVYQMLFFIVCVIHP